MKDEIYYITKLIIWDNLDVTQVKELLTHANADLNEEQLGKLSIYVHDNIVNMYEDRLKKREDEFINFDREIRKALKKANENSNKILEGLLYLKNNT